MRHQRLLKAIVFCTVVVLATQVSAQPTRRGGLWGDWIVKSEFNGRQMESILSFSRDQEGNQTGQWISFWGLSELKDLKYEEGKLSFARVRQNREGQPITSTFKGTIAEGKLSGLVSSDQREYALEGQRAPRMPRAVGIWEMKSKREDREFTSTLTVKVDKEGALTAQWKSERGEPKITDVQYSRGKLTFKMQSSNPDRQWEAAFEGTLQQDGLAGVMKSERGEMTVEGKRAGAALMGTWNLEITSDRGTRQQRLRINPDMSGLYGSAPVEKVNIKDDQVDFKITLKFGDREFEMSFQGKIEESKLVGEMTTSMGEMKITGTKVIRRSRRRGTM